MKNMENSSAEQSENPSKNIFTQLKTVFNEENLTKAQNRYIWPIGTLLVGLRPLHHWAMGRVAQIQEGQRVLEVGSGYPLYKLYSHKVGKDGVFIALDIDPVIQQRAQKIGYWIDKFLNREHSSEQIVVGDAGQSQLPFPDKSFDTLIASNFTGGDRYVEEAFRVLRPGGRLITTFTEFGSDPKNNRENARLVEQAGFTEIEVKRLIPASVIPGQSWNFCVEAIKPNQRD